MKSVNIQYLINIKYLCQIHLETKNKMEISKNINGYIYCIITYISINFLSVYKVKAIF